MEGQLFPETAKPLHAADLQARVIIVRHQIKFADTDLNGPDSQGP
jgi:hypothetical protein